MTFLKALFAPSSVSSASALRAAATKRLYCSGSSGFVGFLLSIRFLVAAVLFLIPVVPSLGAGGFNTCMVGKDFSTKSACVRLSEQIDVGHKAVDELSTYAWGMECDGGADWSAVSWLQHATSMAPFGVFIVRLVSGWLLQPCSYADSFYGARSAPIVVDRNLYGKEIGCGFVNINARRAKNISALLLARCSFGVSYSEPSDYDEGIGEVGKKKIGEFGFVAQPRWEQSIEIRGGSFLLIVIGLLLLNFQRIYFIGATLVMCGISLSLYGPDVWFLWSAHQ